MANPPPQQNCPPVVMACLLLALEDELIEVVAERLRDARRLEMASRHAVHAEAGRLQRVDYLSVN